MTAPALPTEQEGTMAISNLGHSETKPAAYIVKRYGGDGALVSVDLSFTDTNVRSSAKTEFVPLYRLSQKKEG